jgi:uncharacterized phage-associated protein
MLISFEFDARKAALAMAYIVSRLKGRKTDKVKLMKLLYLADREHFLLQGRPITGDDQYAMPYGPVPTLSLDLLDGQFPEGQDGDVLDYLETRDHEVILRRLPGFGKLDRKERKVLDAVIDRYGAMDTWELTDYTHKLPEYRQVFRPGTSTRMPFELMLKLYASGTLYRHNRPVITSSMAANMTCPFARSETDL